jgi:transposase-like protein
VDTPKGAKMREECSMTKRETNRKRRSFTPEFKAEAVRLCRVGDRSVGQVATDLDLTETALREWVKRADVDAGNGPPGALTTDERNELRELRKRVKRLEMEREILKKAAAFFAKENG